MLQEKLAEAQSGEAKAFGALRGLRRLQEKLAPGSVPAVLELRRKLMSKAVESGHLCRGDNVLVS